MGKVLSIFACEQVADLFDVVLFGRWPSSEWSGVYRLIELLLRLHLEVKVLFSVKFYCERFEMNVSRFVVALGVYKKVEDMVENKNKKLRECLDFVRTFYIAS